MSTPEGDLEWAIEYQHHAAFHSACARSCVEEGTPTKLKIAVWHQRHAQHFAEWAQRSCSSRREAREA